MEQWRSWWALCGRACSRCMTRRSGGRRSNPDILPRWPRDVDFAGVGRHCGKRLRERLREATGNSVLKRLATAVLEEVRRVLEERIGSGGNKVVQFMACTHRGCSYVLLPGKRNAATRIPTVLQPHFTCTRAVLAISYRVVVGLQRSCGSSINPEVVCRKKHELRENSGITKLLHQGTRRTTHH